MSDFPIVIAAAASPEVPMNENLNAAAWVGVYARDPRTSSALTWAYFGSASPSGTVLWGGVTVTAGTFTLTDNADNYIVVNRSTGATTCGTATTNWTNTASYARVYKVTTVSGAVTVIADHRAGPYGVYGQSGAVGGGDVVGPASAVASNFAQFDGTTGKLLKDGGLALDTDGTLAADSDVKIATQKAVKTYVTQTVNARKFKGEPARAKTTAALAANTYANGTAGVGATLTGNANGALAAQDGVTLVANDCLLVSDEVTGANNGLYLVTQVGDASNPYILTRRTDADESTELVNATVYVSEGTAAGDQQWTCTTDAPITVGTTALVWAQTGSGSAGITALTGDVTASGTGSVAATLATVNSNVGTFGDATHVAAVTVNAKGLVTAVSSVAITGVGGSSAQDAQVQTWMGL